MALNDKIWVSYRKPVQTMAILHSLTIDGMYFPWSHLLYYLLICIPKDPPVPDLVCIHKVEYARYVVCPYDFNR